MGLVHVGQLVEILTEHFGNQLDFRKIRRIVLAFEFTVAQYRYLVTDCVNLVEEVRYEYYSNAAALEVEHELEQLLNFLLVEGGSRLVQDKHLAVHIDRTGYRDHLLHRKGAASKLLIRPCRDIKRFQKLSGVRIHLLPFGESAL